jgi:hypothetical protein
MVFGRIRRVHGTLKFIHSRTPDYIRLARQDVTAFRRELLEALLSLGVGAAAGMFFMCFLSVAIAEGFESRYSRSADVDMFAAIQPRINGPCSWPERE